jgi:hypothetical protein
MAAEDLFDGLFEDVESDPLWIQAGLMAGAPPRPLSKGHGVYSLPWLARVLPVVRSADQLVVALLLYRECLLHRSNTVALLNGELRKLGISRQTKYRALDELREAGAIITEQTDNRCAVRVTLLWFP